jgi:hypothetical protein
MDRQPLSIWLLLVVVVVLMAAAARAVTELQLDIQSLVALQLR